MITEDKLRVFKRYMHDYPRWEVGQAAAIEYKILSDQDWGDIDRLLSRLYLVKAGKAAASFAAETLQMLAQMTATPDVANQLQELVNDWYSTCDRRG